VTFRRSLALAIALFVMGLGLKARTGRPFPILISAIRNAVGCINVVFRPSQGFMICNECSAIVRTFPVADLEKTLTEMELSPRCGQRVVSGLRIREPLSWLFEDGCIHVPPMWEGRLAAGVDGRRYPILKWPGGKGQSKEAKAHAFLSAARPGRSNGRAPSCAGTRHCRYLSLTLQPGQLIFIKDAVQQHMQSAPHQELLEFFSSDLLAKAGPD
jgi:hypothetical protein